MSPVVRASTARTPEHAPHPVAASTHSDDATHALSVQVDKLTALINRLEKGEPTLRVIDEEKLKSPDDAEVLLLLSRTVTCTAANQEALIDATRSYVNEVRVNHDIRTVACRVISGDPFTCVIYEFWSGEAESTKALAAPPILISLAALQACATTHTVRAVDVPLSWFAK